MIRQILPKSFVPVLMIFVACQSAAMAQDGDNPPKLETRVIDIRSLLLEVPDYRATFSDLRSDDLYGPPVSDPDQFGNQPKPPAEPAKTPTQEQKAEDIMDIISSVVEPESWYEGAEMRFYAGQLIISQTPQILAEVDRLIGLLKTARSATVRLEAWFVRIPVSAYSQGALASLFLKEEFSAAEFISVLEAGKDVLVVTRVTVAGFDGQRVFTTSGTQINAIIGATAVVAASSAAFEPQVRQLIDGVTLEVQPVIDSDRKSVLLDLRASIAELDTNNAKRPTPDNVLATGNAAPPYRVAHFAGSFAVPLETVFQAGVAPYDADHEILVYVYATVK